MNDFAELNWDDDGKHWSGNVSFDGTSLPTFISFDINAPSESDRERARDAATILLQQLTTEWERRCRHDAAAEITEAAYSQSDQPVTESLVAELLADLKLTALEFMYCTEESSVLGTLGYVSPKCFPDMNVQINFNSDLSIDEVMVTE